MLEFRVQSLQFSSVRPCRSNNVGVDEQEELDRAECGSAEQGEVLAGKSEKCNPALRHRERDPCRVLVNGIWLLHT